MENCIYCIEILHPIGMLDRDQRTTKIRQQTDTNYCDTIRIPRFHIVHHQHHQHDHHLLNRHLWTRDDSTRLHCGSRRIQSCHHHQKTLSRLLKVLIIGIYISFLKVPCVYSRPTNSPSCQNAMSGKGNWWINPNNYTSNTNENGPADDPTPIDKMKSLNPLLRQVNASLQRATESMENNTELKNRIEMYRNKFFTWIDSKSNDSIKSNNPELTQFLLATYEDFQRAAVGIDHGIAYSKVHNQMMVGSESWDHILSNASHQLRLVLTEIQTVLMEMNVTIEKNVNRDIIPENLRSLCDNTDVGIFNAIVYRHYFKFLNEFNEMLSAVVETL